MLSRFGGEEKEALCRVIDASDKTLSRYSFSYRAEGGEVWNFEREFARWLGRKYCVAVNSGTSALFVAIKALSVKTDALLGENNCLEQTSENIALPAYTFVADAEAVIASGNRPFFQDIDEKDYCVELDAQLPLNIIVHTLGNVCPPERFERKIPYDLEYKVIEDCAQCVGGAWKGKKAGTFGDISIFSGQGTKNLSCGEGGWLCMDDEELMERCRAVANHGDYYKFKFPNKKYPYLQNILGHNLRMTEMQAAIARCQLKKLPMFLKQFKKNAELIFDLLPAGIEPPYIPKEVTHAYFILGCKYKGDVRNKQRFLQKLLSARRNAGLLWSKKTPDIPGSNNPPGYTIGGGYSQPLYELPLYRRYKRSCPNTERVIEEALWFDIHRWSSEEYIKKNMEIVNKVYRETEG